MTTVIPAKKDNKVKTPMQKVLAGKPAAKLEIKAEAKKVVTPAVSPQPTKQEEKKPVVTVNASQKSLVGRTYTPEQKRAQLNPEFLPTKGIIAQQDYDGISGFLAKQPSKTAINFSLFRKNTNLCLTSRDLKFMRAIRNLFGADYFTRYGKYNDEAYGLDAGTIRHAITGGYINVRPGFATPLMAPAGECQYYLTIKGLRSNYGSIAGGIWHGDATTPGKKAAWDGKSAAFRAGEIDASEEAAQSK